MPWRRRGLSVLAVALCLFSAALAANGWVGYVPTTQAAWDLLAARPLPDEGVLPSPYSAARGDPIPAHGTVLPADIGSAASGFKHRTELVYLPPAYSTSVPSQRLPVVMMIGGVINTPADWLRAGDAITTADHFAAAHGGYAPVMVFVDAGGSFGRDTECVNGARGDAADHLLDDVVPYMVSTFRVSSQRENWAVVGWSMGGTCAVDLAAMHPERFSTFVDIDGDWTPNDGTKAQTIARLYGGKQSAWAQFDPTSAMRRHGAYAGVSGWFDVSARSTALVSPVPAVVTSSGAEAGDPASRPGDQRLAAASLCQVGESDGIDCLVTAHAGRHDWPFAGQSFARALPWLAGRIGTPDVTRMSLSDAVTTAMAPVRNA